MGKGELNFIILDVIGTDDFLQFTSSGNEVELDMPLKTPRQWELEPHLRSILMARDITPYETAGSYGDDKFLDAVLGGGPERIADEVSKIMQELFSLHPDEEVRLKY